MHFELFGSNTEERYFYYNDAAMDPLKLGHASIDRLIEDLGVMIIQSYKEDDEISVKNSVPEEYKDTHISLPKDKYEEILKELSDAIPEKLILDKTYKKQYQSEKVQDIK